MKPTIEGESIFGQIGDEIIASRNTSDVKNTSDKSEHRLQTARITDEIDATSQSFSLVVSKDYLNLLSYSELEPYKLNRELRPISWYRITEIVLEKGTFFIDKLSMVYTSLYGIARTVALLLKKDTSGKISLYLGARDFDAKEENHYRSGKTLEHALNGFLPGIKYKEEDSIDIVGDDVSYKSISSVSGVASLLDEDKKAFSQGIERLINSTPNISYTALFIAENISDAERESILASCTELHSAISPIAESQTTFSRNESHSVSSNISKSFSMAITKNLSTSITLGKNNSESIAKNRPWNISLTPFGIGGGISSKNDTEQNGRHVDIGVSKNDGTSLGHDVEKSSGKTDEHSKGISIQINRKDRRAKLFMDILDKQIERLEESKPFGLWSCSTYFMAFDDTTAKELANIYRGCVIGVKSNIEVSVINSWSGVVVPEILEYMKVAQHPRFIINSDGVQNFMATAASIVNSKELAIQMSLPYSSIPGIIVREKAAFGREVLRQNDFNECISVGKVLHLGNESRKLNVEIGIDSLSKHTFVTGTTGSGKSNFMYLLLDGIKGKGIPFMVIEPVKGEYKNVFNKGNGVSVYGSNNKISKLLRINPLSFDHKAIHVYEHIDRLVAIFNACWPMTAAMPVVLKKSIIDAYKNCGWDLKLSSPMDEDNPLFPCINDVIYALKDFINSSEYSDDTKSDYKGAIETRLIDLTEGLIGSMLNTSDATPDEDLFEQNVVVDLSRIGNNETRSLIMGLLIMKLNEYRLSKSTNMQTSLSHVTVIEEAHNILKRVNTEQSQDGSNLVGLSVEMISNGIAEMRSYGEGFVIVDQSPSQVDPAAIRNTNTKVIFSLPDSADRDAAGKSVGLSEQQIDEIGKQKVGQAVIYQNDWEEAVQCAIKEYETTGHFENDPECIPTAKPDSISVDIVRFLISGRTGLPLSFDLLEIERAIKESYMMTSIKTKLLSLLSDYNNSGAIELWDNYHYLELSNLLTDYMGVSDYVAYLLKANTSDFEQLTTSLENLISQTLSVKLCKVEMCSVIQCLLRSQSVKDESSMKLYKLYYQLDQ